MKTVITWLLFFACTIVAGSSSAVWSIDAEWYQSLNSPSFKPPGWIFGPVWSLLYLLIATAAYRVMKSEKTKVKSILMGLWALQMVLNTIWTPVFFGGYNLGAALIYIVILWVSILAFVLVARHDDKLTSWIMVPYLLWVSFATLLNGAYWMLNPTA